MSADFMAMTGLSEGAVNTRLAGFLNLRGFDMREELGGEGECFSVDAHQNELVFYVQFKGSYGNNIFKQAPLFTHSLDSIRLIVNAMNTVELATYRHKLIRSTGNGGLGLGERAVDADAPTRAAICIISLGLAKKGSLT